MTRPIKPGSTGQSILIHLSTAITVADLALVTTAFSSSDFIHGLSPTPPSGGKASPTKPVPPIGGRV